MIISCYTQRRSLFPTFAQRIIDPSFICYLNFSQTTIFSIYCKQRQITFTIEYLIIFIFYLLHSFNCHLTFIFWSSNPPITIMVLSMLTTQWLYTLKGNDSFFHCFPVSMLMVSIVSSSIPPIA